LKGSWKEFRTKGGWGIPLGQKVCEVSREKKKKENNRRRVVDVTSTEYKLRGTRPGRKKEEGTATQHEVSRENLKHTSDRKKGARKKRE